MCMSPNPNSVIQLIYYHSGSVPLPVGDLTGLMAHAALLVATTEFRRLTARWRLPHSVRLGWQQTAVLVQILPPEHVTATAIMEGQLRQDAVLAPQPTVERAAEHVSNG